MYAADIDGLRQETEIQKDTEQFVTIMMVHFADLVWVVTRVRSLCRRLELRTPHFQKQRNSRRNRLPGSRENPRVNQSQLNLPRGNLEILTNNHQGYSAGYLELKLTSFQTVYLFSIIAHQWLHKISMKLPCTVMWWSGSLSFRKQKGWLDIHILFSGCLGSIKTRHIAQKVLLSCLCVEVQSDLDYSL